MEQNYFLIENDYYTIFKEIGRDGNRIKLINILGIGATEYLNKNKETILNEYEVDEDEFESIMETSKDEENADLEEYIYKESSLIKIPLQVVNKLQENYILSEFNGEGSSGWSSEIYETWEEWKRD